VPENAELILNKLQQVFEKWRSSSTDLRMW